MKEKLKKGYIIFITYYMYFFVAAVVGWVYEVLTIMLENHHGFQNRGVRFGPYLTVYGVLSQNPFARKFWQKICKRRRQVIPPPPDC